MQKTNSENDLSKKSNSENVFERVVNNSLFAYVHENL